jgi:outer membrane protein OmpA-like peptidoglycan-associated protein
MRPWARKRDGAKAKGMTMRTPTRISGAALLLVAAGASGQSARQPTVDEYICTFSDACEAVTPGAPSAGEATMEAPGSKGFRVARSPGAKARSETSRASAPARAHGRPRRSDLRIGFALGSDRMTADGIGKARVFAAALSRPELSGKRFRIGGHTDSSGNADANRALSQRRAEAVAAFLVDQGVQRSRLEVRGFGADAPLAGRAASDPRNRRVEAELIS